MSRVTRPALRGSLLGTLLWALNPIVRILLISPLHWPLSRWFAVIRWRGRKTGRSYSTPVSYIREGSTAYVTTGDRWWRNLVEEERVTMRIRGRWLSGTGTPVTAPGESRAEHDRLFRAHPWFRMLSGVPGNGSGGTDAQALDRAIASGRVLVRVDLT